MKKTILTLLVLGTTLATAREYTQEDRDTYKMCQRIMNAEEDASQKTRIVCEEMFAHPKWLKRKGAEDQFKYWWKRVEV